jgi:hypothetical protein
LCCYLKPCFVHNAPHHQRSTFQCDARMGSGRHDVDRVEEEEEEEEEEEIFIRHSGRQTDRVSWGAVLSLNGGAFARRWTFLIAADRQQEAEEGDSSSRGWLHGRLFASHMMGMVRYAMMLGH